MLKAASFSSYLLLSSLTRLLSHLCFTVFFQSCPRTQVLDAEAHQAPSRTSTHRPAQVPSNLNYLMTDIKHISPSCCNTQRQKKNKGSPATKSDAPLPLLEDDQTHFNNISRHRALRRMCLVRIPHRPAGWEPVQQLSPTQGFKRSLCAACSSDRTSKKRENALQASCFNTHAAPSRRSRSTTAASPSAALLAPPGICQ